MSSSVLWCLDLFWCAAVGALEWVQTGRSAVSASALGGNSDGATRQSHDLQIAAIDVSTDGLLADAEVLRQFSHGDVRLLMMSQIFD